MAAAAAAAAAAATTRFPPPQRHPDVLQHSDDDVDDDDIDVDDALGGDAAASTSNPSRKKIRFAPWNVPISRRMQTLAVLLISLEPVFAAVASLLAIRASGWLFYAFLAYCMWMMLFQNFHQTGALYSEWARKNPLWKLFADYFPLRLHKTTDVLPDRSYIFVVHPHGMIGFGALCNLATDATGFDKEFPGIRMHLVTLRPNFRVPFHSIHLGLLGVCDASKKTFSNILSRGNGHSVCVAVGGAKESLDSHPGTYDLTLNCRKGFVKMALAHGASLVPVFSFGETDVYSQVSNPRGSLLRSIQERLQQKLGFAMPVVRGRGVFNYNFGLLPFRMPINTVVGAPIHVDKVNYAEITPQMIDQLHSKYIAELQRLYDRFKNVYAPNRKSSLRIVQ